MATDGQLLLAPPTGHYAVGHNTIKLIDEDRTDRYDPASGKRAVMISIFYPVEHPATEHLPPAPYMPSKTAATLDAGLAHFELPKMFGTVKMHHSTVDPEATNAVSTFPLVLFSPGLTFSRFQYNALAQSIASEGYAVVTMDHTHETTIVEFPDGTYVLGKPPTYWDPKNKERHEELLSTRVEDASFVLTQLGNRDTVQALVPGAVEAFDTGKAIIFGHSFGGTTAISMLMKDSRIVGAINMDGSQYGPLADTDKPVLLFGRGEPSPRNRSNNTTWQPLWERLKGKRWEVNLRDSEHLTFCDTPLLIKLSGMQKTKLLMKMIGTLEGERAFDMVTVCIKALLGAVLRGEDSALLDGPTAEFPELVCG